MPLNGSMSSKTNPLNQNVIHSVNRKNCFVTFSGNFTIRLHLDMKYYNTVFVQKDLRLCNVTSFRDFRIYQHQNIGTVTHLLKNYGGLNHKHHTSEIGQLMREARLLLCLQPCMQFAAKFSLRNRRLATSDILCLF